MRLSRISTEDLCAYGELRPLDCDLRGSRHGLSRPLLGDPLGDSGREMPGAIEADLMTDGEAIGQMSVIKDASCYTVRRKQVKSCSIKNKQIEFNCL